jgi:diguanylate cyclase (GGDEF)-like protein/PAS domain S-box-containing protein
MSKQVRKGLGESLAVQIAALLESDDRKSMETTLRAVLERNKEVRSAAVRRIDGVVVAEVGDHDQAWREPRSDRSTLTHLNIALNAGEERWGALEVAFRPEERGLLSRWIAQPVVIVLLFLATFGMLAFWLYMARALQHLDPSSVIPDRIRAAFDVMTEGVVILDRRGRIMLANKAFARLQSESQPAALLGKPLSSMSWLEADLPADESLHPWVQAMADGAPTTGYALEVREASGAASHVLINCAPILDQLERVKGCLATFDDVTELHRSNERLRETLVELAVSKEEINQKNEELHRLAKRDSLTGSFNRRAFFEALERMYAEACEKALPLSCLLIDIDHFKGVNETYGHAIGDRVIGAVARLLAASSRTVDVVGRYGGEEFCVALPGVDHETAVAVGKRICKAIEEQCGKGVREVPGLRVTVSVGVAALSSDVGSVAELVSRADRALYQAKRTGRNQVCRFDRNAIASNVETPAAEVVS